ncbi:MAG TPA: universal stress protein [Actinomycetota bacterium]|nr:universal stress protein [Actinomycetota bacterium]
MLEKILLAVDGSQHARKAVPATIELARAGQGTVHVLHVRELAYAPAAVVGDSREEAAQLVAGVVTELKQAGVTAEGSARSAIGGPAGAILEQARDLDAGMIVLGSRELSPLSGLLLGSVAHKIIQLAPCPVLVIRDH